MPHCALPVIAAVNGPAIGGGCELALACDMRLAGESATFGLPEVLFGALPGAGDTQRLPRVVGPAAAKEMIMTGRPITAAEARRTDLVSCVVPDDALRDAAMDLALKLADRPRYALTAAKFLVDEGVSGGIDSALRLEATVIDTMASPAERAAEIGRGATTNPVYGRLLGHRNEKADHDDR